MTTNHAGFSVAAGEPAMIQTPNPQTDLKTALADFETNLVRPIVSGELTSWLDEVKKSWTEASAQVHYHLKHLHPRQYDEIAKQDPELLPRIELLKTEDDDVERQREQLAVTMNRVAEHVPKLEPDEEKAQKHTKQLVDEGTAFLTRVRKQEVAVQTWYVEAFNRDGGAVD